MLTADEHMAIFAAGLETIGSNKSSETKRKEGHRHRPLLPAPDSETTQFEAVRVLIPAFEAKTHRMLARVWGSAIA